MGANMRKPTILLHACCATCLCYPFYHLSEKFEVVVYFYNPNIYSMPEYEKRLRDVTIFTKDLKALLFVGEYENKIWDERILGLEKEPEGGARCEQCFKLRLEKTAAFAKEKKYDFFASTLPVSPHKNYNLIKNLSENIGNELDISFYDENFRKKDGFKKTIDLSKENGFYRQNFCGCIYSLKNKDTS